MKLIFCHATRGDQASRRRLTAARETAVSITAISVAVLLAGCTSGSDSTSQVAASASATSAAPSASSAPAGSTTQVPSSQCVFGGQISECTSSDPTAAKALVSNGNCSTTQQQITINWGDSSPAQTINTVGPSTANTPKVIANHTFAHPGVYPINITGSSTSGPCAFTDTTDTFTYDVNAASGPVNCTAQNPSVCLLAANAVAGLDIGSSGEAPDGWTEKNPQVSSDGFAAAVFTDTHGDVIIANEDADLASPFGIATEYQNGSFLAETQIYAGKSPGALSSAVQFAKNVAATSGNAKIYVTGLGLGGVEAEAEAQALGTQVTGGVTFGAPGLPGNTANGQTAITNIIDYGDPVGNWASDSPSELAVLAGDDMAHFGGVELTGNLANAEPLRLALAAHEVEVSSVIIKAREGLATTSVPKQLLRITQLAVKVADVLSVWDDSAQFVCYSYLAYAARSYHTLAQYAGDLNVSLNPTVAPAIEAADFRQFDPNATTATLQTAAATTVSAAGSVTDSSYDATANASAGDLDTQTFTDSTGSDYVVTYNAQEQISTLAVNEPDGTSYVISNDDSGQEAWSTRVYYYSGPNQTGTLTGQLYNWRSGGSQLKKFTGLPAGTSQETIDYSQPDAAGTPTSTSSS